MTLQKDGRWLSFECDHCTETTDEHDGLDELLLAAKRAGWEVRPDGGEWAHTCPTCRRGSRLARQQKLFS